MSFYQNPPTLKHPYQYDEILKSTLKRILPNSAFAEIEKELCQFGSRVLNEMEPLSKEAEANPPVHIPFDAWGKRVDEIKVSKSWTRLHEIAAEEGIVAIGYERKFKEFSRVHQFAKLYLYHPSSAIYSCPLAMTDGAARVLELYGSEVLKKSALLNLISREPRKFWTSGQWMTERTGGSDVSGTSTIAKKNGDQYFLYGDKWFTSATTSQMAMTLAKIEGDEKLSLFYVELRDEKGELQNIQINRLKDKLGTKALPTAELSLLGVPATLVGEVGKGVKTIATLFNITRLYNSCCAVGYMKRGIALSVDYSKKREAFGKPILNLALHAQTLSDLQVRFEASFLMMIQAALLLGKEESKVASLNESGTLRLLIPLVKLYTAKEGVNIASEIIESFGGAGYIEDTGLPVILRNAQVLSIWEGTTNVLALDAIRAIKKENAAEYFLTDVTERLVKIFHKELTDYKSKILDSVQELQDFLKNTKVEEDVLAMGRILAMNLSRVYCASLLLEHAQWSLEVEKSSRSLLVAKRFLEKDLVEKYYIDQNHRDESQIILS
jgi:putative acyl-CoA dehydrogenase